MSPLVAGNGPLSDCSLCVSFMGVNLPNHAYVDLTLVGDDISDPGNTVRSHSDLTSCCSGSDNFHRGDLYFPGGNALATAGGSGDIYKLRDDQVIHIHCRNNAMSPSLSLTIRPLLAMGVYLYTSTYTCGHIVISVYNNKYKNHFMK